MSDIKLKINPYRDAGTVHDSGLDALITAFVAETSPTVEEIIDVVKAYFYDTYFTSRSTETIPRESIGVIISRANNFANDYMSYVSGAEVADEVKMYLYKVWNFVGDFRKYAYSSDGNNIFTTTEDDEFNGAITELENEIMDSSLIEDHKILPLVACAVLRNSYTYWYDAYNNTGGANDWYTWITSTIGGIQKSELHWKGILQNDLAGAVIGAVEAFINGDNFQSIIIGGAAGSITTSVKELSVQIFNLLQETGGLLEGGENNVTAAASNATYVSKHIVNVTTCAIGNGVTLPRAKAGNVMFIMNTGTGNDCLIARSGSDTINGGTSAASIANNSYKNFFCPEDGKWITQG